ncbi:SulP family inorganic anion transporter [Sinosporangium siamense]|uniref:SLC26A/SulP transporter domain-containing protein n=1 Tax=Sinosporangium siamense TaxID=1367973 RepID=A0A919RKY0_9ACTN|nr:SulP family inorganic anion transporter [Sinosporangium siamense]GII95498.1 hypothetical protein Ssi02_57290 [Sinosporangium siamense]
MVQSRRARHAKSSTTNASTPSRGGGFSKEHLAGDLLASLVVFLVAVPLCIGIGVASGVPVELGIISGIIGGLVVGFLPGSSLQVSGPAAGLATLCLDLVTEHGVEMMGPIVLVAGLIQVTLGILGLGRIFQAISLSVVGGMLGGIGVSLLLSQIYAAADSKQHGNPVKNAMGLPDLLQKTLANPQAMTALALGIGSLVICFAWKKVPAPINKVPAPLVAVVAGALIALSPSVEVKMVTIGDLFAAVQIPGIDQFAGLMDPSVLLLGVTFAAIASAESLFSAAATDRMHDGEKTKYNPELLAQGVGNTLCGLLGSLPLTAVIARSAANVQAGAKTKISRVMHGVWLLGFGLFFPQVLGYVPVSVLAGILLQAGWKLLDPPQFGKMWRKDRGEGVVLIVTTVAIIFTDLLEGVIVGLAIATVLAALRMSHLKIDRAEVGDVTHLTMVGNATFLLLPKLNETLDSLRSATKLHINMVGVSHLDLACRSQVEEWAAQHRKTGADVELLLPEVDEDDEKVPDEDADEWFADYPRQNPPPIQEPAMAGQARHNQGYDARTREHAAVSGAGYGYGSPQEQHRTQEYAGAAQGYGSPQGAYAGQQAAYTTQQAAYNTTTQQSAYTTQQGPMTQPGYGAQQGPVTYPGYNVPQSGGYSTQQGPMTQPGYGTQQFPAVQQGYAAQQGPVSHAGYSAQQGPVSHAGYSAQQGPVSHAGYSAQQGPVSHAGYSAQQGPVSHAGYHTQQGPVSHAGYTVQPDYGNQPTAYGAQQSYGAQQQQQAYGAPQSYGAQGYGGQQQGGHTQPQAGHQHYDYGVQHHDPAVGRGYDRNAPHGGPTGVPPRTG